jgi:hypothetical protein
LAGLAGAGIWLGTWSGQVWQTGLGQEKTQKFREKNGRFSYVLWTEKQVGFGGVQKVHFFWSVVLGADPGNTKFPEKSALLPFFDQKKTVSWGIVHGNRKIGPPLGRSFEKWFAV